MTRRRLAIGTALVLVWGWSAVAAGQGIAGDAGDRLDFSLRTHETFRLDCTANELSSSVVLFGNGTVRLRERGGETDGLRLAELYPEELTAFLNRLREVDLSETPDRIYGPSGEMLEQCLLRLRLDVTPGAPAREVRFPKMAAMDLALHQVLRVIDDVVLLASERERSARGLPAEYEPRVGDVLVKENGDRFRIDRWTADGKGAEISGFESPLVLYIARDKIRFEFHEIERRGRPPIDPES